jgi:hypothetical protein
MATLEGGMVLTVLADPSRRSTRLLVPSRSRYKQQDTAKLSNRGALHRRYLDEI